LNRRYTRKPSVELRTKSKQTSLARRRCLRVQTFLPGLGCAASTTKLKSLILRYGDEGENVLGEAAHRKLIVLIRKGGNLYGKVVKRNA